MGDQMYAIEPSSGARVTQPSEEQVRSMVERVGRDLQHCILTIPSGDFVQTTGDYGSLWFQYTEGTGVYTSVGDYLSNADVAEVFAQALRGDFSWRQRYSFEREELPEAEDPPGVSGDHQQESGDTGRGGFGGATAAGMFSAAAMNSMVRRAARGRVGRGRVGRGGIRVGPGGVRVGRRYGRRRYGRRSGILGIVLSLVHMFVRRRR